MAEREEQVIATVELWREGHPAVVVAYPAVVLIDPEAPGFDIETWLAAQRDAVKATLAPLLSYQAHIDVQVPLPTPLNRPSTAPHAASPPAAT